MRAFLGLDRLNLLEPLRIKDSDHAGRADRHIQQVATLVVHDDVGGTTQRQPFLNARNPHDPAHHDQLSSVRRAEEPTAGQREAVRTSGADVDPARVHRSAGVDCHDDRRVLDVHVDPVARWIERCPPRPTG